MNSGDQLASSHQVLEEEVWHLGNQSFGFFLYAGLGAIVVDFFRATRGFDFLRHGGQNNLEVVLDTICSSAAYSLLLYPYVRKIITLILLTIV